jgi:superfamily II DNA or RNA helicase
VELLDNIRAEMRRGVRRILLTSPTGSGKTILMAHMTRGAVARNKRVHLWVHRRELLKQTVNTFSDGADLSVGIVSAGVRMDAREPVQICSVQSLRRRFEHLPQPDVVIVDEAHHQASKSYADLAEKFPRAFFIGVTATAQRLDGRGLGAWFDVLLEGPSTADLIAQGWLAPYRLIAPPSRVDLSGVHTVAGDYNKHEAADAMQASTVVGDALTEYQRRCAGKRALLFAWSIEASKELALKFQRAGIPAAHVDGTTPERERDGVMTGLRAGTVRVVSNVDLVSEGFDVPDLDAVFLLRPTASLGLYLQQVGRALRPAPGKTALIIDHVGNYTRHGLPDDPRVWSLDGAAKQPESTLKVKTCARCYAVERVWAAKCSQCGAAFIAVAKPREVEQVEGELAEVDVSALRRARAFEEHRCTTLDQLVALGVARGYKAGWARLRWEAIRGRKRQRERLRA